MYIQKYCNLFRTKVLCMTLKELSAKSGVTIKTLSAFEHGRSNNINHLNAYANACTPTQLTAFMHGLKSTFEVKQRD